MSTPQPVPSAALPTLRFVAAQPQHHAAIAALITTPEELFLVHPPGISGMMPNCRAGNSREQLTVGLLEDEVVAFANLYQVQPGVSAFIGYVIVAEAAKGRGIGQALVAHMVALCRQKLAAEPRRRCSSVPTAGRCCSTANWGLCPMGRAAPGLAR